MSRLLDGSGASPSGFQFDRMDTTATIGSVKRIAPALDDDVDIGSNSKRFKTVYFIGGGLLEQQG